MKSPICNRGRDGAVGIAIRYGMDDPGTESRWGWYFSASVQTGPGAHPAFWTMGTGSHSRGGGVKRPERGVDPPPASSAKVKERVDIYLCSPSGSSWPVLGWTLPFTFTPVWNITEIRPVGAALIHANGQTDGHDEANRRLLRLRESALKRNVAN
jgi:hypothetical protein